MPLSTGGRTTPNFPNLTRAVSAAALALVAAACTHVPERGPLEYCPSLNPNHVCELPFELVYLDRHSLIGRRIRVEGLVVVGVRPEPIGAGPEVILLFPTLERAQLCRPRYALELVAGSPAVLEELRLWNGQFISVAGKLKASSRDHWGEIEVRVASPAGGGAQEELRCMTRPQVPDEPPADQGIGAPPVAD